MCKKLILLTSFVLFLSLLDTNVLFGQVIERRISVGTDDAEEAVNPGNQDTYNTSSDLEIIDDNNDNGGRQFIGLNFRDISIAPGTQIGRAYIEFVTDASKFGNGDAYLLLWGHLTPNPDGFANPTPTMISDRPRTQTKVPWEPEEWTAAGQISQTANISAIIQELIDQEGWASGNAIEIIIGENTSKGPFTGFRNAESYNGSATLAPLLHIELATPFASMPDPADGALLEDTWVSLTWSPGKSAVSHDVYLGDNLADVEAGEESTFWGNQISMTFITGFPGMPFPEGLVPGTTYYWRIDEVEADSTTKHKGLVWSFRIPPKTAYFPDPADSAESVDVDVQLSWTGGYGAKLHTVYFGNTFEEVDNAAGGLPQGALNYNPGTLKMAKTYYWRVDEFDVAETHKGNVWSFITQGAVESLDPVNGAVDVTQTPILTWAPGFGASHEVYFGVDATSIELKGSGNLGSESYDAGQLEWDTTYYWRIDEANNVNADSPWTGPLWNFTTANFLIIDDFESYNDLDPADPASNRIFNVWLDGFDNPATNGSVVGNANPPFAEQTIVHSGSQSMPMAYDNAVGKSEATLTLTSNRDWTVNGVNTLTIWFRGDSANTAETLYVALNGNVVVNNDNPDAALTNRWTEWNIDLQAFADQGVNLANVSSITLGLSSVTGGAGMMYFDDFRLYAPAP